MSTMYCNLCKRPVEAKRNIGIGTIILILITGGVWLLTIPFYSKRCTICKSDALTDGPSDNQAGTSLPYKKSTNWIFVVAGLAALAIIGNLIKPTTTKVAAPTPEVPVATQQTKVDNSCRLHPLESFPIGDRFERNTLNKLVNDSCPNAQFLPNDSKTGCRIQSTAI